VDIKITPKAVGVVTEIPILGPNLLGDEKRRIKFIAERLGEKDIQFIEQQFKDGKKLNTNELKSFGFKIVAKEKLNLQTIKDENVWKLIEQEFGKDIVTFEMPVFNRDYNKAYLWIEYLCGLDCGTSREVILSKNDDKWIIEKNLMISVK
jgi:hypothetical protein